MASDGHDIKSDESLLMCSNCVKVKRNREAVKYCVECQAYCCQTCVDSHETIPALSTHQLLDKTSFKSSGVTTDIPVVPTEKCYLHEAKIVDFFCKSHDVVGCSTCMVLEHRQVQYFFKFDSYWHCFINYKNIFKSQKLQQT